MRYFCFLYAEKCRFPTTSGKQMVISVHMECLIVIFRLYPLDCRTRWRNQCFKLICSNHCIYFITLTLSNKSCHWLPSEAGYWRGWTFAPTQCDCADSLLGAINLTDRQIHRNEVYASDTAGRYVLSYGSPIKSIQAICHSVADILQGNYYKMT